MHRKEVAQQKTLYTNPTREKSQRRKEMAFMNISSI